MTRLKRERAQATSGGGYPRVDDGCRYYGGPYSRTAGGQQVLEKLHQLGKTAGRVYLVWADGGYSGPNFLQWAMDTLGWIVQVVLRPREAKGFVLVKKRWIVERTFGWWRWSRRLVQDYEQLPENAEAMLQIAMIRIMLRRLA